MSPRPVERPYPYSSDSDSDDGPDTDTTSVPPKKVKTASADVVDDTAQLVMMTEFGEDVPATEGNECAICTERKRQLLIQECKHFCLCFECARVLIDKPNAEVCCPLCRTVVKKAMVRIFA